MTVFGSMNLRSCILPGVIQKEYELLRESIEKDDIFGSVFRLKDIYEICLKIPVIIAMIRH